MATTVSEREIGGGGGFGRTVLEGKRLPAFSSYAFCEMYLTVDFLKVL